MQYSHYAKWIFAAGYLPRRRSMLKKKEKHIQVVEREPRSCLDHKVIKLSGEFCYHCTQHTRRLSGDLSTLFLCTRIFRVSVWIPEINASWFRILFPWRVWSLCTIFASLLGSDKLILADSGFVPNGEFEVWSTSSGSRVLWIIVQVTIWRTLILSSWGCLEVEDFYATREIRLKMEIVKYVIQILGPQYIRISYLIRLYFIGLISY